MSNTEATETTVTKPIHDGQTAFGYLLKLVGASMTTLGCGIFIGYTWVYNSQSLDERDFPVGLGTSILFFALVGLLLILISYAIEIRNIVFHYHVQPLLDARKQEEEAAKPVTRYSSEMG